MKDYKIPVYKLSLVREKSIRSRNQVSNSEDAAEIFNVFLKDSDRESLVCIMLGNKNRPIGVNVVSTGTINSSIAHPREVFKPAILSNAAGIIIGHNHPSGDPEPSHEDRNTTKRMVASGKTIGIPVLDHIIVGDGYFSFADNGMM